MDHKGAVDWSSLPLERSSAKPLVTQLREAVQTAVTDGRLRPGDRLPSWRDLAAQLGLARGTVQAAYERLGDEGWIAVRGAAGTHVADAPPLDIRLDDRFASPLPAFFPTWHRSPLPFQGGVPADKAFPKQVWSRLVVRAARQVAAGPTTYPDPRGDPDLRREIAAYLSLARGFACSPGQVFVTAGFAGALSLLIHGLGLAGRRIWMEEPGFPLTRLALQNGGVTAVPVPVDEQGLIVSEGEIRALQAAAALVTPGQHAPFGMTLARSRRIELLDWAKRRGAWIIEDDYLGDLQLGGRAAPALASLDSNGRVFHVGSFSKTMSPALRLGYLVSPPSEVARFGEMAAVLNPAPCLITQRGTAAFMAEGHFFRHLRRMKQLYGQRRDQLATALREAARDFPIQILPTGNFLIPLVFETLRDDKTIAARAYASGLAPVPLSPWFVEAPRSGLLLGVTNYRPETVKVDCARLIQIAEST